MSEYTEVEQPFLQQLQALGWDVIDQGQDIPSDPSKSLRPDFDIGCYPRYLTARLLRLTPGSQQARLG